MLTLHMLSKLSHLLSINAFIGTLATILRQVDGFQYDFHVLQIYFNAILDIKDHFDQ